MAIGKGAHVPYMTEHTVCCNVKPAEKHSPSMTTLHWLSETRI